MNKIELVIVLAITAIVVLVWVSADIFFAPQSNPENLNVQTLLEPVTTTFDQQTLDKIKTLATPGPTSTPAATSSALIKKPSPTPIPTPSPRVSVTPSASATASATTAF